MSSPDFYSRVARKFGRYQSDVRRSTIYRTANPEQLFDEIVLNLAGSDRFLLDVGCADGRNVLRLAPAFQTVYAIDLSLEMLVAAQRTQQTAGVTNIHFERQDGGQMRFADATFDVVSSRRGPTFVAEFWRVLKPNGHFVSMGIGERDADGIKQVFGRGQFYGHTDTSLMQLDQHRIQDGGFTIVSAQELWLDEYYYSRADLSRFLEMVPIFEDYDPLNDAAELDCYIEQAQTDQGIHLPRHRYVLLAQSQLAQQM